MMENSLALPLKQSTLLARQWPRSKRCGELRSNRLEVPCSNPSGAERGRQLFANAARCATCHVPPTYTEPGWNMHSAQELGIDDFQANRAPDKRYRTAPLNGLWTHTKGGFYHDGRFATLRDVLDHYNTVFSLALSEQDKNDLIEYLKSL